jgi:acetyl-CoA synthetase
MSSLLDIRSYPEALRAFRWDALWGLFDGDRSRLNLAHECVDRHVERGTALRIKREDGRTEAHSFPELAVWSSRFAHFLARRGVERGDRVAIMLDPSLPFYGALFGAVKRGAIAVPLFTLFGPDGVAARVEDCRPTLLVVEREAPRWRARFPGLDVVAVDEVVERLAGEPEHYAASTAAADLAVFQYTSGTTRARPAAVRHTHRAVVTLMVGALYGVGLERGDRYFCPSSPAWGHGLWHGTIAPLLWGSPSAPTRANSREHGCWRRSPSSKSRTSRRRPRCFECCGRPGSRPLPPARSGRCRSRASPWTRARSSGSSGRSAFPRAGCTGAPRSASSS